MRRGALALSLILAAGSAWAAPQTITGSANHVSLLELYTSEGCDSCPPAEKWISTLQQDDRLWKQVVPVTFHVDYWDDGGWRDPFDRHAYTERQQAIAAQSSGLAGRVIYTPQFVLDGQDWRNFYDDKPLQVDDSAKVGPLSFTADGHKVTVHFSPTMARNESLEVYVVLMAFGVDVPVGAGENKGVTLRHDFLVVSDTHGALQKGKDGSYTRVVTLSQPVGVKATRYALAGWVSALTSPLPIQAAGGWVTGAP
ncbi:MAG TPA: DUF1223 domain-containing protein [Gammaproteobacteria bacterium]|jgi:hypothetical protein